MANIKNFGLVGIGADVQFGKGGSKLVQTDGTFAAKNATGNAFVKFQVATGVSGNDAVTFDQLTNAVSGVAANTAAIQDEIDAIELGAGLNADGTYTAPAIALLANATSLKDADGLLANAIALEQSAREAADTQLGLDLANAAADLVSAQAEIDTIETAVGLETDGTLTLAAGNYLANAVDLVDAIEILDGALGNVAADVLTLDGRADALEANVALVQADLVNTNANVATFDGRLTAVEANTTALAGLVDGLRTDVDSNAALLANTVADVADHETRIAALETSGDLANAVAELQQDILDEANARADADTLINANVATVANAVAQETADRIQAVADEANARTAADAILTSDLANAVAAHNALAANAVLKDGSVAMTGTLDLAGNKIANVATPTELTDAASKGYVDTKVAGLANAFEYIGTLAGGADAANAVDMANTIAAGTPGDYYKITTAGYFMLNGDTANAAYFNMNDGLVFNSLGGFDKIDNTDSTVAGTAGKVVVTGTVDTGYVVDIDGAYTAARQQEVSDEANARTAADAVNAQAITDEANARIAADAVLASDIANAAAAVAQEVSDRANAVADEASLRTAADAALASDIANTNANVAVVAGDLANTNANVAVVTSDLANAVADIADHETRIAALETSGDLANAVAELQQDILDEANARVAGDALNAQAISDETNARVAADTLINANVALVAADLANTNADLAAVTADLANAQTEIDAIEAGAGLETDGTYVANATANYITNATSLKNADDLLDAAIKAVSNDLANLSQDEIVSLNGLTSVKAANAGVQFYGDVGGVKTLTGEILTDTANTNTSFQFDTRVADEVILRAIGDSTDVDLRLAGQGAGHVIIGETGVGVIQADDGYDMTVAGGLGGGNLNLLGATTKIGAEDGTTIAQFSGVANATSYASVVNGTSTVTLSAAGAASNIDLVFAPKGTGTVNVSGAKVVGVANATAATDAVNKGQLDTAIAAAEVGHIKTAVATLTEVDGTVTIGSVTGTVVRVRVLVTGAFGTGAAITVGSAEGTANELAAAADIDEATAGIYVVETAKDYTAGTIQATISGAAVDGTGSAKVIVEYLAG